MNGDYTSDGPYVLSFSEMERRNADLKNILFQTIETNKSKIFKLFSIAVKLIPKVIILSK